MGIPTSALATDLYQLTMMQGYFHAGLHHHEAVFDLFYRKQPFEGGYAIFAGLEEALQFVSDFHFTESEIAYLDSLKMFRSNFLDYLRSFRFTGTIHAMPEGSVVFPHEPLLRVQAPIMESQLMETALLNIINFQTLVATKAARICDAAGEDSGVVEFGLRRAQGPDGGLAAARASIVGGFTGTSNVQAGYVYGIPVKGTHAHSWVTAFPDELTSFREFAFVYPDNTILLVDTYDTLKSGVPNAIRVGLEMKERGESLFGIRLDSGDLAYLSTEARKMLDGAGLTETRIVASNELDEYVIRDLRSQGAKIDIYGVGTKLVTCYDDPALSGVYKLAAIRSPGGEWEMKLKLSEGKHKSTIPGIKQVYRLRDHQGEAMADIIELEEHPPNPNEPVRGVHPQTDTEYKIYEGVDSMEPLLQPVLRDGKRITEARSLMEIRESVRRNLSGFHPSYRRLLNPHIYKVSLGPMLGPWTYKIRHEAEI